MGLDPLSHQGDITVVDVLRQFGADVSINKNGVTVKGGKPLFGIEIDASQIPDMIPAISVVAAVASGTTVIRGAERLRLKESDRLSSVCNMLTALGADVKQTDDGLVINGRNRLSGGTVNCFNDHRIAMSAAISAAVSDSAITVNGAECVAKSYPDFWDDVKVCLGLKIGI
jgi:3-phosphoshikimate 1-carboxyvinyltransferase